MVINPLANPNGLATTGIDNCMTLPKYQTQQLKTSDYEAYLPFLDVAYACKFFSAGRSGNFQLRVFITRPKDYPGTYYNLGFGVWDSDKHIIDDVAELRNGDFQHILATIANVSLDFLKTNPSASLYAEGSTPARTRLYQREIARHHHLIPENLQIYGLIRDNEVGFIEFRPGINFDAFLLSVK
ncbi:DUF6934 family protein [Dyadobacter jiangsuensis]|uniref:Uncharacterized protein n=1 Tax=Dyadobacter jiangsuensis TaxID=1591085 RepID=A0A2P8GBD0_9BACT|nr:hypothetical protein [Dyadobacter jiangsuensis]PSL31278.1 hypothetical protein CLV60_103144 [Dyadobacter jiangsuensis]